MLPDLYNTKKQNKDEQKRQETEGEVWMEGGRNEVKEREKTRDGIRDLEEDRLAAPGNVLVWTG